MNIFYEIILSHLKRISFELFAWFETGCVQLKISRYITKKILILIFPDMVSGWIIRPFFVSGILVLKMVYSHLL
jgi:hypothetical protein